MQRQRRKPDRGRARIYFFFGGGVSCDPRPLRQLPEETRITGDAAGEEKVYPRASAVGFAAMALQGEAALSVEPVYLRSSQAERMRARREKEKRA